MSNNTFLKRREYVNKKFGNEVRGKSTTPAKRSRVLKRLWREAKRKFK